MMNRFRRTLHNYPNDLYYMRTSNNHTSYIIESEDDDLDDDIEYDEDIDNIEDEDDIDNYDDIEDGDTEYVVTVDSDKPEYIDSDFVESLESRIMRAVDKLNGIRKKSMKIIPNYKKTWINPNTLEIKTKTLNSLEDKIEDEGRMLEIYMQERERKREIKEYELDIDDMNPDNQDLEDIYGPIDYDDEFDEDDEDDEDDVEIEDNDIFDSPEKSKNFKLLSYNDNFDEDSEEGRFIQIMNNQLKDYDEVKRTPFCLYRKSQPDVEYYVTVLTNFNNKSFLFNILGVDGEECSNMMKIPLNDIDFDNTDVSEL